MLDEETKTILYLRFLSRLRRLTKPPTLQQLDVLIEDARDLLEGRLVRTLYARRVNAPRSLVQQEVKLLYKADQRLKRLERRRNLMGERKSG